MKTTATNLDFSRCREKPYDLQRIGIETLVKWDDPLRGRTLGGCLMNTDEMGLGKTFQTIGSAQFLSTGEFEHPITQVLVIAPNAVRAVWFDDELGELRKHLWEGVSAEIYQYHKNWMKWTVGSPPYQLRWVITNYEFIRRADRFAEIKKFCNPRTLLVLDESSLVKSPTADQAKACLKLRQLCGRVQLLNGTPIANTPGDMYMQGAIMNPKILDCKTYWHFKARYAVMGGYLNKQILAWRMLEDMQDRFGPYVLRRLVVDSIDLPKRHDAVPIHVPLTPANWKRYTDMRDDFVAWIDSNTMSMATQAGVKVMRMSQITSGFLGGIDELPEGLSVNVEDDSWTKNADGTVEIGREKLDAFLEWFEKRMQDHDWDHKILAWSRFRAEVFRTIAEVNKRWPQVQTGMIIGSQKKGERRDALRLMDPRTSPAGPVLVLGTPASGSMGLNCTAGWTMVYLSNDYNLKVRLQSMARQWRLGQLHECYVYDFVATGPKGQQTSDHHVLKALSSKDDLANWTAEKWRQLSAALKTNDVEVPF